MDDEISRIREKRIQELKERMKHTVKAEVTQVDEIHFQEFIRTHPFVVLDFWAEWCAPCRRVGIVLEELSKEFSGKVTFGKCNTEDNRHLAMQFNITAIPSIMLFSNGQLVDRIIGAYPKEALREKIVKKFNIK
ncbi:MAG: thioredoxin [Methanoregula sp.]